MPPSGNRCSVLNNRYFKVNVNFLFLQEIGGVSKITEACDWWSLGALLFELLTGMVRCHFTQFHVKCGFKIVLEPVASLTMHGVG